jgi:site-specific DNA-cytosine methylase
VPGLLSSSRKTTSKTIAPFLKTLMRSRPDIIIGEQVRNFLHIDGGKPFEKLIRNASRAGYQFSYGVIQLAKLGVPQYCERIWCLAIRGDVHNTMGDITITMNTTDKTPPSECPAIGKFLEGNSTYTAVICSKSQLTPEKGQVYQRYKPYRMGTIFITTGSKELNTSRTTKHIVWGPDGTSPCI